MVFFCEGEKERETGSTLKARGKREDRFRKKERYFSQESKIYRREQGQGGIIIQTEEEGATPRAGEACD
jgi:hypothetical protein